MYEEVAKTKACPFRLDTDERMGSWTMQFMNKQVSKVDSLGQNRTVWVPDPENIQENNRCIGSMCMAWRHGDRDNCLLISRK